ncbi:inorganic diphosphatase [Hymenobacter aerophilus]|uniref:inorganic diphosphatase n=1 Tax=Hymenobacter aerophilus TaxID=119644 RepID=UPI00036F1A9F|nr:inorganic diphosphatase [Hymenobacter aerophilus]
MRRHAFLFCLLLAGCEPRYADLPTFSAERKLLQLVVETPAGTNREQRYNPATNAFEPRRLAGLAAVVEFLPAPGNLGFVAGTSSPATAQGQPVAPLPALLLAESQPTGTVLEVLPIALLTLDINGQLRPLVVAVPARPSQRILPEATDWASLRRVYPGVQPFVELWFRHRAPNTRIVGWKDEKAASQLIRQWMR